MQVCRIGKYEAHGFIDGAVGNKIMLLSFDRKRGISESGKRIRKKRGKRLVDKASIIVYSETVYTKQLDLCGNNFTRTLLIPKYIGRTKAEQTFE